MAERAGALIIPLGADYAQLGRDMRKATGIFDAEGRKIERSQARLRKTVETGFGAIGTRLTAVLSAAAVIGFTKSLLDTADALSDSAEQLGVTVSQLQGLDYAARISGASSEKLATALGFLTNSLGDAEKGEGDLAKFMRANNIQMGDTSQVLYDIADRVKNASTQQEKMNISVGAFGKAGKTMVSFLNQGADGIRRLQQEAAAKGQIWDPETIARLDQAKDSFETLKNGLTGLIALPLSKFVAALAEMVGWLNKIPVLSGLGIEIPRNNNPVDARSFIGTPFKGAPVTKRTPVPKSTADTAKDAAEALRDAQKVNDIIARAKSDTASAADDYQQNLSNTARASTQAILQQTQGWTDFAKIQRDAINDLADLDIRSLNIRKDAALRTLKERQAADFADLQEAKGTVQQQLALVAEYNSQRHSIEAAAAEEAKQVEIQRQADISQIQTANIQAADMLREGFVQLGLAARHGLGDMGDIAKRTLDQLIDLGIQLEILRPLAQSLFGATGTSGGGIIGSLIGALPFFANGTNNAPGGLAVVGERGPEIVNLPRGSQVIPNAKARNMGGGNVYPYFDLRGAVMTQDLIAQMNAIGKQAANEGAQRGASAALRAQPMRAGSYQKLGT